MYSRVLTIAGVLLACVASLYGAEEPAKPKRKPIYLVDGKGAERVEVALVRARKDNTRVLLKIGGNWCGWCYKLQAARCIPQRRDYCRFDPRRIRAGDD